jgi:hypothetical protein
MIEHCSIKPKPPHCVKWRFPYGSENLYIVEAGRLPSCKGCPSELPKEETVDA